MDQLKLKIPEETYNSLINANIKSLSAIMLYSKTELAEFTKLEMSSVEKVVKESAVIILKDKIGSAHSLKSWQRLSTGCSTIDNILNGGVALNGITEIVGCSGVGKTQICLQLALMTQLPTHVGGLEKSVVYICTEDVFPVKRLKELSQRFQNKYKNFITKNFEDNIYIEHIADSEQLKRCLFISLPKLLSVKNVGLVVIDSIAGPFRSENLDVNYINRSQDFISIAVKLNKLSDRHKFAVICVNQVSDNIETGETVPCLGLAWSNIITCRFNISRYLKNQIREFEVVFAPDLKNKSCRFKICSEGLLGVD